MQRLSSGLKINSAADDVAGYAISQSLQSQVNGLNQAGENIQDAVAMAQTAQGALNDVNQMLQRVRELSVEYSNGTTSEEDQKAIVSEVSQLSDEIKRVGETTSFNGKNLLNADEEIKFQVGANDGESIGVTTVKVYSAIEAELEPLTLGERLLNGLGETEKEEVAEFKEEIETEEKEIKTVQEKITKGGLSEAELKEAREEIAGFQEKITEISGEITKLNTEHPATGLKELDEAIATVSGLAGEFGAVQDRIQFTQSNLEVYSQNLTSAVSALVDVNMATEMTNFTKDQVLQQAGVAILSQANQLPDAALHLIEQG
jgi:flagellin